MSKVITAREAADLIADEAVVTVSSSSGLGCGFIASVSSNSSIRSPESTIRLST